MVGSCSSKCLHQDSHQEKEKHNRNNPILFPFMTLITVIMFAFLTFFLPPYSPFDLHIEKKKHIYVCLRQD